jgi:hypothetical protein
VSTVEALIVDLGQLPRTLDRELREGLRRAAEPIAADARSRASWSNRIPGAIRVRTRLAGRAGVSVRVSSRAAPHARPIEHKGQPGNFRHPVFADAENQVRTEWTWVNQRARPFLGPAAEAGASKAAEAVADVIDKSFRQHGWR